MKVFAQYGIFVIFLTILMQKGCAQRIEHLSCLKRLAPCLHYLNGTKHPPHSCCDPLKSLIHSNPKCMCMLISNKATRRAEKAGININEAQQLPGRCGQHVNPLACLSVYAKHKKSVHNSASTLSSPSLGMKLVAASFMAVQILWAL